MATSIANEYDTQVVIEGIEYLSKIDIENESLTIENEFEECKKGNEYLKGVIIQVKENERLIKELEECKKGNEYLKGVIRGYASQFNELTDHIKKVGANKLDLNRLDKITTYINNNEYAPESVEYKGKKPDSKRKPKSFHTKNCDCIGCDVSDLSNKLYYICIDYIKKEFDDKTFKSLTIDAVNECRFVNLVVNTKDNQLLKHYRESYLKLGIKYRELLKKTKYRK
tara:strand:+ start:415 stop:1092 length:678 start_codon:yes stop_codon:yes gene_type:complete